MKIALIGYGKMGLTIEHEAIARGHEIIARIKSADAHQMHNLIVNADVAIEFTRPEAAINNMLSCFQSGIPVVTGTTGWYDEFEKVAAAVEKNNGALFYASNFSLGVNIFFEVNKLLAKLMSSHTEYLAAIKEIHHIHKLDAPSGTAISIAEQIIEVNPTYDQWQLKGDVILKPNLLPIEAERSNQVPGTHEVSYTSSIDTIQIRHEAHSRKGFALGALLAAEFLHGRKGVFNMSNLLDQYINHGN
jgi:4-hydroxy-tetrahydrodipicolinate reductase